MKRRARKKNRHTNKTGRFSKVFRDPIHDLIALGPEDEFILELIDTKEFQRLRRIRQLGLAHLVYPGAEHTRFVHSLGAFNFARRMIDQLCRRHSGDRSIVNALEKHAPTIKAAALLHDLGHGPFSHVYERAFASDGSHERWTCNIVDDASTEVGQKLRGFKKTNDLGEIRCLISDKAHEWYPGKVEQAKEPFLKDIVSSQLDADRMDYLLRDSALTGARYGSYDSSWILNALAIGKVLWAGKHLKKLCLDRSKGTGAIEGFLFARMLMTQHVYRHKTTRAYESELLSTLRLAAECVDDLPQETPEPILEMLRKRGCVDIKTYLMLDDELAWWALRRWAAWKPRKRRTILTALSQHALNLVRRLEPWGTLELPPDRFPAVKQLIDSLDRDNDALRFECWADDGKILPYRDLLLSLSSGGDPEQTFFQDIFLVDRTGKAEPLSSIQPRPPVLDAMTTTTWKHRFFYNRLLKPKFAGLLKKHGVLLG